VAHEAVLNKVRTKNLKPKKYAQEINFSGSPRAVDMTGKKVDVGADILAYFDLDMNGATTV
jgi:hypothetical protein